MDGMNLAQWIAIGALVAAVIWLSLGAYGDRRATRRRPPIVYWRPAKLIVPLVGVALVGALIWETVKFVWGW